MTAAPAGPRPPAFGQAAEAGGAFSSSQGSQMPSQQLFAVCTKKSPRVSLTFFQVFSAGRTCISPAAIVSSGCVPAHVQLRHRYDCEGIPKLQKHWFKGWPLCCRVVASLTGAVGEESKRPAAPQNSAFPPRPLALCLNPPCAFAPTAVALAGAQALMSRQTLGTIGRQQLL